MAANKDSKTAMPAWHPNFRIAGTLPDTKLIRTSFLVNAAAVSLLLGVGAALVMREMDLRAIDNTTAELNAESEKLGVEHRAAIPLQKQFADAEKRFAEFEAFRKIGWPASRLLERLSATLPRMVTVTSFEIAKESVEVQGSISGSLDQATGVFNGYLESLVKDAELGELVTNVRQHTVKRNQQTGQLGFTIKMDLKKRT